MGNTTAFSSDIGEGTIEAHNIASFVQELDSFIEAFLNNNEQINGSTFKDFIKIAKEKYGIDVKLKK